MKLKFVEILKEIGVNTPGKIKAVKKDNWYHNDRILIKIDDEFFFDGDNKSEPFHGYWCKHIVKPNYVINFTNWRYFKYCQILEESEHYITYGIPKDRVQIVNNLKEIGVNKPPIILKPRNQERSCFYFKDPEDEFGYQEFFYLGYYNMGKPSKFSVTHIRNDKYFESAVQFLEKHHIPYEVINENEIIFDAKYVDFTGFNKFKDSLDEIGINNPNINEKIKQLIKDKIHSGLCDASGAREYFNILRKYGFNKPYNEDNIFNWVDKYLSSLKVYNLYQDLQKHVEKYEDKDLLDINELDIQRKNSKNGSEHEVYPFIKNPNFVIKTFRNQAAKDNASYWINIFQKYPQYFPKIEKITDKYVVLEKLDDETFKDDALNISNFIRKKLNYSLSPHDLAEWTYALVRGWYNAGDYEKSHYKDLFKEFAQQNPELFEKYKKLYLLIHNILKDLNKKYIDVHNNNFGYDSKGNLKMLDI